MRRCSAALREPFVTSRGRIEVLEAIEYTLIDADGASGVGWASPATRLTGQTLAGIEAALKGPIQEALRATPPDDPEALHAAVAGTVDGHPAAMAAADLALHDLLARRRGQTLGELLGARAVRVGTDVTVGAADAGTMVVAAEQRVGAGFDTLKLKVGAGDDVARVTAVVAAVGTAAALRLDANQGWTAHEAVAVLDALHARGVELQFVEQPVAAHDLDGMRWVRERSPYPVMADESAGDLRTLARLLDAGAADMVNIKLARLGGIVPAVAAAAMAGDCGVSSMVGSMLEMPGAVAASVFVASTLPWPGPHDLDAGWWLRPGEPASAAPALRYEPPEVQVCC